MIGLYELYRVFKIEKSCAVCRRRTGNDCILLQSEISVYSDMMLFVIALLVVLMFVYVFSYPKYHTEQMLAAFLVYFMYR